MYVPKRELYKVLQAISQHHQILGSKVGHDRAIDLQCQVDPRGYLLRKICRSLQNHPFWVDPCNKCWNNKRTVHPKWFIYVPWALLGMNTIVWIQSLTGELHLKPKLSLFCVLSQNYQHTFEENNISILKQIVWETQKWHWNLEGQVLLEFLIKTIFCMFWLITQESLGLLKL